MESEQNLERNTLFSKKSFLSVLFTSILQDPEMSDQYVIGEKDEEDNNINNKKPEELEYLPQLKQESDLSENDENKTNVSRLQIQIERHKFQMIPLQGQVFFLLFNASLQGRKSSEIGLLMMTNFRIVFFKEGGIKRVDLPFGLIQSVQYVDKQWKVIYQLKYSHMWRFKIISPKKKYSHLKNFGYIYYKSEQLRNNFAFQYCLKLSFLPQPYRFDLDLEYRRLKFYNYPQLYKVVDNQKYTINQTYPEKFFVPICQNVSLVQNHRKNKRFPILAYHYLSPHNKLLIPLWISSQYQDIKKIDKISQGLFLKSLSPNKNLQIFVTSAKNVKIFNQKTFYKHVNVSHLKLDENDQLRKSQIRLVEVFLFNKTPFIREVLLSKWYFNITKILESCIVIRNTILQDKPVLIRCEEGWDKALLIASLIQITLDPYFRTIGGFQDLVMRMFVHNGYPFATRLGQRNQCKQICPIFLQFLDCVTQLIYSNPTSFEFNFKYLSRISNLMYTNIYGTFIANSPKQYTENNVQIQTVSIWNDLISPITKNGNYNNKKSILEIHADISSCRLWREHFGTLVSKSKDHYGYQQLAEDNEDYLNLQSLRIKEENALLKLRMKDQMHILEKLLSELKQKNIHL